MPRSRMNINQVLYEVKSSILQQHECHDGPALMGVIARQLRPKSRCAILRGLRDNGRQQRNAFEVSFVKGHIERARQADARGRRINDIRRMDDMERVKGIWHMKAIQTLAIAGMVLAIVLAGYAPAKGHQQTSRVTAVVAQPNHRGDVDFQPAKDDVPTGMLSPLQRALPGSPAASAPGGLVEQASLSVARLASGHSSGDAALTLPLLVDEERGRLYGLVTAWGASGASSQIAVFAARDGKRLLTYEKGGPFALDARGNRLFVDRGAGGIAVLEATTGRTLRTFANPGEVGEQPAAPATPQFDGTTNQLLVFRGHTVYVLAGDTGRVIRTVDFDLRPQDNCRVPHDAQLPVTRSFFDPGRRILYLEFVTYSCIPWIGYTVVSYDLVRGVEIARQGSETYSGLAAEGRFYAEGWHRFGIGTIWSERDGRADRRSTGWTSGSPFQLDPKRKRLYQSADGSIRVFDPVDLSLQAVVRQPVAGELAAFDAATDQLYFVEGATVRAWAAGKLAPVRAAPVRMAAPAAEPVRLLVPSPDWGRDKTLLGIWAPLWPETECYVFGQSGGTLLLSQDGGVRWQRPQAGLPSACAQFSALAVSPAYAADRTVLAGVKGHGIFKSTDRGASWQPASKDLPHMAVNGLAFSPGFAADRTAFATVPDNGLQRSTDGAASWHTLKTAAASLVALSPEFDRDGTLAVYGMKDGVGVLQFSEDRGNRWRDVATPGAGGLRLLSLAPAFARWKVMFALDGAGELHRSDNGAAAGAASWQRVLATGRTDVERTQLAYGPTEKGREVFLLASGTRYEGEARVAWGMLFRSADGGQTWAEVNPGAGIVPAALALSPGFAEDGLIFLGAADGLVHSLRGMDLPAR